MLFTLSLYSGAEMIRYWIFKELCLKELTMDHSIWTVVDPEQTPSLLVCKRFGLDATLKDSKNF